MRRARVFAVCSKALLRLQKAIDRARAPQTSGTGRVAAARGCRVVPLRFRKTGKNRWKAVRGKPLLRATCKRTDTGATVTLRPRKAGANLRSAVGKKLSIGMRRGASVEPPEGDPDVSLTVTLFRNAQKK